MYYDYASATDQQDATTVWSDYQGVWHLNGTFTDSTGNGNTGTNTGTSSLSNELIGDSRTWDGVDDRIDYGSGTSIDNLFDGGGTISVWMNPNSEGESFGRILEKRNDTECTGWNSHLSDAGANDTLTVSFNHRFNSCVALGAWNTGAIIADTDVWRLVTITYNNDALSNDPIIYLDGISQTIISDSNPSGGTRTSDASDTLWQGNRHNGINTRTFDGDMDEPRLHTSILSADWLESDFDCQRDLCITVGAEGTESAGSHSKTLTDGWVYDESLTRSAIDTAVTLSDDFVYEEAIGIEHGSTTWYNHDWSKRKEITISDPDTTLTNYQVNVTIAYDADMRTDYDDIRFTDADGITEIDFHLQSIVDSTNALAMVEIPSIPDGGKSIYMYYGNSEANTISSGVNTYNTFDGFEPPTEHWELNPTTAVYSPTSPDDRASWGSVWFDETDSEYIYCLSARPSGTLLIDWANSTDGITWTDQGNLLVSGSGGSWDDAGVWDCELWEESGTWYMVYTGHDGTNYQIGLATTTDDPDVWTSSSFTKDASNPIFTGESGKWDYLLSENLRMMKEDGTYYLYYNTLGETPRQTGIASTTLTPENWESGSWTRHFDATSMFTGSELGYFQPMIFKANDNYYMGVQKYGNHTDWSRLELWTSETPTFDTKTFVRYLTGAIADQVDDIDTPSILTKDISRSTYYDNSTIPVLYGTHSGDVSTGDWATHRLIVDFSDVLESTPDVTNALSPDPNGEGIGNLGWVLSQDGNPQTPTQPVVVRQPNPVEGNFTMFGNDDETTRFYSANITSLALSDSKKISTWININTTSATSDSGATMYIYEGTTLKATLRLNGNTGTINYWNGAYVNTGVAFTENTWYQMILEYDHDPATETWNGKVVEQDGDVIWSLDGISFGNGGGASTLDVVKLRTELNWIGDVYYDSFFISEYNPASDPFITLGSEEVPTVAHSKTLTDGWAYEESNSFVCPGCEISGTTGLSSSSSTTNPGVDKDLSLRVTVKQLSPNSFIANEKNPGILEIIWNSPENLQISKITIHDKSPLVIKFLDIPSILEGNPEVTSTNGKVSTQKINYYIDLPKDCDDAEEEERCLRYDGYNIPIKAHSSVKGVSYITSTNLAVPIINEEEYWIISGIGVSLVILVTGIISIKIKNRKGTNKKDNIKNHHKPKKEGSVLKNLQKNKGESKKEGSVMKKLDKTK